MDDHTCPYIRYLPGARQPWYGLDDVTAVRRSIRLSSGNPGYKLYSLDAYDSYVLVPCDLWFEAFGVTSA